MRVLDLCGLDRTLAVGTGKSGLPPESDNLDDMSYRVSDVEWDECPECGEHLPDCECGAEN